MKREDIADRLLQLLLDPRVYANLETAIANAVDGKSHNLYLAIDRVPKVVLRIEPATCVPPGTANVDVQQFSEETISIGRAIALEGLK